MQALALLHPKEPAQMKCAGGPGRTDRRFRQAENFDERFV